MLKKFQTAAVFNFKMFITIIELFSCKLKKKPKIIGLRKFANRSFIKFTLILKKFFLDSVIPLRSI